MTLSPVRTGSQLRYTGEVALGWAAVRLGGYNVLAEGSEDVTGDPVDHLIDLYREHEDQNCAGMDLYRYTPTSFRSSQPRREGMSHAEHNALIDRALVRLRAEGINVTVKVVRK